MWTMNGHHTYVGLIELHLSTNRTHQKQASNVFKCNFGLVLECVCRVERMLNMTLKQRLFCRHLCLVDDGRAFRNMRGDPDLASLRGWP